MADILIKVDENVIPEIARAIMNKTGKSDPLKLPQFASEIESISSGGSGGGSASLNIHYGDTEPTDTSMLWCKCATPSEVLVDNKLDVIGESFNGITTKLAGTNYNLGASVKGTKVYLFGGLAYNDANAALDTIQIFDTKTNAIETLTVKLPTSTYGICAETVGEKIYLFGGYSGDYLNRICVFDTTTNTIETLSKTLPTKLSEAGSCVVGKKIYLFGGSNINGKMDGIYVFDTETNTTEKLKATISSARTGIGVGVVGEKVYLFGGNNVDTIEIFDTTTNTISKLSVKLPNTLYSMGIGVIGEKIYLIGGSNGNRSYLNSILAFDIKTNTIETLSTTLPISYSNMGFDTVGGKIYLFGGRGSSGEIDNIYYFSVSSELAQGKLQIISTLSKNIFNILNGVVTMKLGCDGVYLGNVEGQGEQVEAYLYQNGAWTLI